MEGSDDAGIAHDVAKLAALILADAEAVARTAQETIFRTVAEYQSGLVAPDDVYRVVLWHINAIWSSVSTSRPTETTMSSVNGQDRARAGIPLSALMDAYNIGFQAQWDRLSELAGRDGTGGPATMAAAAYLVKAYDQTMHAMMRAYRDQMRSQIRSEEQRRAVLVQALLEGTLDSTTLWEAADLLRLPHSGTYVVIAAHVRDVGQHALPEIESGLGELGIDSAWRLMHDMEVGVASLPRPHQLDGLVAALTAGNGRVGVSPPYDDLRATAQALRLARIALRGSVARRQVVVFGQDPLTSAAAIDQEIMPRIARGVFAGLDDLPAADRATLLATFGAWLDNAGSAEATAKQLYVHPNTVRYRLRRLEERTGRTLSDPRRLAELSLAYEIELRELGGDAGGARSAGDGGGGSETGRSSLVGG